MVNLMNITHKKKRMAGNTHFSPHTEVISYRDALDRMERYRVVWRVPFNEQPHTTFICGVHWDRAEGNRFFVRVHRGKRYVGWEQSEAKRMQIFDTLEEAIDFFFTDLPALL